MTSRYLLPRTLKITMLCLRKLAVAYRSLMSWPFLQFDCLTSATQFDIQFLQSTCSSLKSFNVLNPIIFILRGLRTCGRPHDGAFSVLEHHRMLSIWERICNKLVKSANQGLNQSKISRLTPDYEIEGASIRSCTQTASTLLSSPIRPLVSPDSGVFRHESVRTRE